MSQHNGCEGCPETSLIFDTAGSVHKKSLFIYITAEQVRDL